MAGTMQLHELAVTAWYSHHFFPFFNPPFNSIFQFSDLRHTFILTKALKPHKTIRLSALIFFLRTDIAWPECKSETPRMAVSDNVCELVKFACIANCICALSPLQQEISRLL